MRIQSIAACAAVSAALFAPVRGVAAQAFSGVDWGAVVSHDALLSRNTDVTGPNGAPVYDVTNGRCSGSFGGPSTVVVGKASTTMNADTQTWVAAVPLDPGGENGYACWLLFHVNQKTHFALVPGGDKLLFRDGVLVTTKGKPGSANGGHATEAERVRTFHLDGASVKLVDDRASNP